MRHDEEHAMTDRIWNTGDPEPVDVDPLTVLDCEDDRWTQQEPNSWFNDDDGPDYAVSWSTVLEYAPLREVAS